MVFLVTNKPSQKFLVTKYTFYAVQKAHIEMRSMSKTKNIILYIKSQKRSIILT